MDSGKGVEKIDAAGVSVAASSFSVDEWDLFTIS